VGGAIGSFAGSLALNAAAGDKMKDFERRDKGIPMDDPEQRGYLNRLVQQERYYRSGADPNTGLANRLVQQSGAQAQANLARAGGPGTVQNLLSSQNVTNRGLAANAAQAAGMADNMLGMQGNLINMMASRRYDRQRYRRDLSLMQGQQQQQNANNMFSSALGTIGTTAGGADFGGILKTGIGTGIGRESRTGYRNGPNMQVLQPNPINIQPSPLPPLTPVG
jgi:hypothetical protein